MFTKVTLKLILNPLVKTAMKIEEWIIASKIKTNSRIYLRETYPIIAVLFLQNLSVINYDFLKINKEEVEWIIAIFLHEILSLLCVSYVKYIFESIGTFIICSFIKCQN